MTHTWILEVLADMQNYARRNDLPGLAAQLDETLRIVGEEIAAHPGVEPGAALIAAAEVEAPRLLRRSH